MRGKGIGSFLLELFEETSPRKKLSLDVWAENPAVRVYRRHGFKVTLRKNHRFHMEKKLKVI